MKHKYIIIGFLAVLLGLQGCGEFLTVDVPDSLVKEDYWKSKDHAKAALAGVYTQLGANIQTFIYWGGFRSEIYGFNPNASNADYQFKSQDIRITNGWCNWRTVYRGIYWTNSFLKNAHLVMDNDRSFSQTNYQEMMGQAYAVRALYYFYLVRTFRDVPYHSEPYESDTQSPYGAVVPEETVLDSIETDLNRALAWAPESFDRPTENYGYVTKNAVRALWADVKLWRQKYEECVELCEQVDKDYSSKMLTQDTWFSMFSAGNSKESIFEYQYLDEGPESTVGALFYSTIRANNSAFYYNVRKVYPQSGMYNTIDTVRAKRTILPVITSSGAFVYVFKYMGISADNNQFTLRDQTGRAKVNFIFYRYREVLLMKAEALGMLKRYDEAAVAINQIRRATSLETITSEEMGTGESFLDKLICERYAELAYEGKEWFTLVRIARNTGYTNLMIDRVGEHTDVSDKEQTIKARLVNPESWFLPYLDSEVQNNLLLKQKDFYKGKK